MYQHILFDLDGTLIDSADSILEGFRRVLAEQGLTAQVPLDRHLIGPPMRQTLSRLAGSDDAERIEAMALRFTQWYDLEGFQGSGVYPGVPEMLEELHRSGARLHLVTNKRLRPTLLILNWLGWRDLFEHVDTHDARPDAPLGAKAEVLQRLLREAAIGAHEAVYIGDRTDDQRAAAANRIDCILAGWGYGGEDVVPAGTPVAASPAEMLALLDRK